MFGSKLTAPKMLKLPNVGWGPWMGTSKRMHSTSTRGCCEGRFVAGGGSPNDPQTQVGVLVGFLSF